MATLLLLIKAPMQSWGTSSRFDERDTQLEPSKSGVLGIICAALGRDRTACIQDLVGLKMGIRVLREGIVMRDYQTIQDALQANLQIKKSTISPRYYLADAAFLVGLESRDLDLLNSIHISLKNPVWPLYLGRKCFPPAVPLYIKEGVRDLALRECLIAYEGKEQMSPEGYRLILESSTEGALRLDQPVSPFSERRFVSRYVLTELIQEEIKRSE